jgi:hypothetical protein
MKALYDREVGGQEYVCLEGGSILGGLVAIRYQAAERLARELLAAVEECKKDLPKT